MVEHVKDSFESRYSAHSFSVNPGAICGRSNILLCMPSFRNHKEFSVHESHVESGIHIEKNNIKLDKTIVIATELRNENRIHVFDTAPINTIGSIMAGVQEIEENLAAIREHHHNDIITDAGPVENEAIIEVNKEGRRQEIATDINQKTPPKKQAVKEPDYTIHEADTRELLDEIYDTDIALYREFERVGSPDRVETELTKAVAGVIDHAKELEKYVNCYTKAVFQVVGYVSDAFSAPLKPVNEYVISPALDALDTRVRRTLRDDCRLSHGFAQDAGDMSSIVAGLLIPCRISKLPGKITKLKVPDRVAQRKVGNVGKYGELANEGKPFYDGKEVHHFPARKYLKANDLDTNEALSIVLTKEQHAKTRTFRSKAQNIDLNASYRSELARDIKDVKRILKEDGTWNAEIRQSLLKGLDNFRKEYPQLFEKAKK